jgi:DNA-binding MarR family transcriptional regulator
MAHDDIARTGNLLGALSLAIVDKMRDATEEAAGAGAMIPAALVQIGSYPDQPIDTLRRYLGLSHSAAVRVAMQLEEKGWLSKTKPIKGDARAVSLTLTREGKKAMASVLKERQHFLDNLVGSLPVAERKQLTRLLEHLLPRVIHSREESDQACRLCDLRVCPQDLCPAEPLQETA